MDYYMISGIGVAVVGAASYLASRRRHRALKAVLVSSAQVPAAEPAAESPVEAPPKPPEVSELSSLPAADRKKLLNAIWYRCENPRCNYSKFLDIHHIVPELEGGSHSLSNLIVLCSACQTAARNGEISPELLKSWIRKPGERFRNDLDWQYDRFIS